MRVEIHRIGGDIYVNGAKVVFAVDFSTKSNPGFGNTDWILGWAKIGLMSRGHSVPYFELKSFSEHERLAAIPPTSEPQGKTGEIELDNQHQKISGYRELSQFEIDTINAIKALEAKANGMIDHLKTVAQADGRQIALAATHLETAFMHAVRAIAQPERKVEPFAVASTAPAGEGDA